MLRKSKLNAVKQTHKNIFFAFECNAKCFAIASDFLQCMYRKKPCNCHSNFFPSLFTFCCYFWMDWEKVFKGTLSGLRQFLAIESPLKMMKNAFYFTLKDLFSFTLKALFVFTFWSCRKTT